MANAKSYPDSVIPIKNTVDVHRFVQQRDSVGSVRERLNLVQHHVVYGKLTADFFSRIRSPGLMKERHLSNYYSRKISIFGVFE